MERLRPQVTEHTLDFIARAASKIPTQPLPKKSLPAKQQAGKNVRVKPESKDPEDVRKAAARVERVEMHRKRLFISNYLKKPNATQAAILAGFAPSSAGVRGSELLKDGYVAAAIAAAQERMAVRTELSVEATMKEIAKLGFSNMSDYVRVNEYGEPQIDLSDLDPDQWAVISEVETIVEMRGPPDDQYPVKKVKIKLHDKLGSLEKLGKFLGAFDRKRGGGAEDELPEAQSVTYTLNIGNANIIVGKPGESIPQGVREAITIEAEA